ncbi:MAG: adenylate/guanylate cyclase domain-containing protein, partial [Gemmatimonadetes bacterium]|nr:adenylate/guanylate cyclase domain-containing protein [Gemmatimonadota bacterium]
MERRLAAIFALDMVGYSRLMEGDEADTLSRQKTHRSELIDPAIANHHGRVVKGTGDGLLAEFASAVDAVECAAEIQRAMPEREKDSPKDRRIIFRVGINVGDIVAEDGDIYGDGVNVAARIESLADPGDVYISGSAFSQVKNKVALGFEDLGPHGVKNIDEPVQVYRVLLDPAAVGLVPGKPRKRRKKIPVELLAAAAVILVLGGGFAIRDFVMRDTTRQDARATRASALENLTETEDPRRIAVLYFDPRSPQEEVPYLAAGLTEALINELSKVSALEVTSRNGSALFRGAVVPTDSIGRTLQVGTLVDGTVALSEDQVRVEVSLLRASTGEAFRRQQLVRPRAEVFELQDELAQQVALFLREMLGEELEVIERQAGAENVQAWELVQRARAQSDLAAELADGGNETAWERTAAADSMLALAEEIAPEWV